MADFRSGAQDGQDKFTISCARKQERYHRLLGPCKKYTTDKDKLRVKKNIDCNGWK